MSHSFRISLVACTCCFLSTISWVAGIPSAIACDLHGDELPHGAVARLGTTRLRQPDQIGAMSFSENGKLLATVGNERIVHIWDACTGQSLQTIAFDAGSPRQVTISQDGSRVALATMVPDAVRVWQVRDGKRLLHLEAVDTAEPFAISADCQAVASLSKRENRKERNVLRLYDSVMGNAVREWEVDAGLCSMAFSQDDQSLVLLHRSGQECWLCWWDTTNGHLRRRLGCHNDSRFVRLAQRDAAIVLGHDGQTVTAFRYPGDKELLQVRWSQNAAIGDQFLSSVQISNDGSLLSLPVVSTSTSPAESHSSRAHLHHEVWDLKTGKQLLALPGRHQWTSLAALSGSGQWLATGECYGIGIWNLKTGEDVSENAWPCHWGAISSVLVAQSTRERVITCALGDREAIRVWDAKTSQCTGAFGDGTLNMGRAVLSPDGSCVIHSDLVHGLSAWDCETGKCQWRDSSVDAMAHEFVACLAKGESIVLGGPGRRIHIYDVKQQRLKTTIPLHGSIEGSLSALAVSPGGQTVAVADASTTAAQEAAPSRVWLLDLCSGKQRAMPVNMNAGTVSTLAFSPDGNRLAVGDNRGVLTVWHVDGRFLARVLSRGSGITTATFSQDGCILAFGDEDGLIQLWDISANELRRTLSGHSARITGLAYLTTGGLVSGSLDGSVLVWGQLGQLNGTGPISD